MVLVCLFYLSFTYISSSYESKAEQYARVESGNNDDEAYNQAYKHYMDSLGERKVYLGYYTALFFVVTKKKRIFATVHTA